MQHQDIAWDLPAPFTIDITVQAEDTDRLGHANNVVYVRWLEDVSWAHIESLGMTWSLHEKTGKAMAITRTEIDYLASANTGDQLVRPSDGKTLVRAVSTHACVDMKSQRPARAPKEFAEILGSAVVAGGKGL